MILTAYGIESLHPLIKTLAPQQPHRAESRLARIPQGYRYRNINRSLHYIPYDNMLYCFLHVS